MASLQDFGPPKTFISCNESGCQVFEQFSHSQNCAVGGRVSTTGTINGSLTLGNTGGLFGSLNISHQETIIDWTCVGGWIINSDPFGFTTGTVTVPGRNLSFSTRYSGGTVAQSTRGGADQACHITFEVDPIFRTKIWRC